MAAIRNVSIFKRFTDFLKLKSGDMLDGEVTPLIVPTINLPVPANIEVISDVVVNDSDKTFTVPSGKQWKLLYGRAVLTTTATVGNRQIRIDIRDENDNQLFSLLALGLQAASLTERYNFSPSFGNVTEAVPGHHTIPIPSDAILNPGFDIRILDAAAVDAAADDMTVFLVVEETDLTGE